MFRHYLQPLLAPRTVALVGASERHASLGDIVYRNLAAGRLQALYAVNPGHRTIHGQPSFASLTRIPQPPDLAVIATPARAVPGIIADAAEAGIKAAVVLTSGFAEAGREGLELQERFLKTARDGGVRILGPNCLGVMRSDTGLNATFARTPARQGKLALVSQSGAICGAILDWAHSAEIGFSSVVSLGGAADVDFGEILDFLVPDVATAAILLYVEGIRDARRFLSALRTASRAKPVIVLKVGRYASGSKAASSHTGALVGSDAVFDAALRRGGSVRVRTYTQLFAAARILASDRLPEGERLAIVTNGGGPGVVAADSAAENGVPLATLAPQTIESLEASMPPQWSRGNPIDIIGDAPPQRFRDATAAALADPHVDAVLAMYSPVAVTDPADAARAVAEAARPSRKPVLAAWLGDINPNESRAYLEAQGIPNFYTPENAVEAFSFVGTYRRNQAQLLEVPSATAFAREDPHEDLKKALAIRDAALAENRELLSESEAKALLDAFGLPVPRTVVARDVEAAVQAARAVGYPVALKVHSRDITHKTDVGGVRLDLQNESMVRIAFDHIVRSLKAARPDASFDGVAVQPMLRFAFQREVLAGVTTDPVFGPMISFGAGGVAVEALRDTAVALPPLNVALARDLMERTRVFRLLQGYRDVLAVDLQSLAEVLCGVSRMVCALPWLKEMDLNPVFAHPGGAMIADARVVIDRTRLQAPPRYGHMAIHPYPVELASEAVLRDGARVPVRPMRPDDVEREKRFFDRLSERSRYQRFMQYLPHLPPQMLARFTQLDYDRELALVALQQDEFVAVGRYAPNPDGETAEFALVVADDWQGKGLGRVLLQRLRDEARKAGYKALYGNIMEANHDMLDLALHLGFVLENREGADVTVVSRLA